MKVLPARYFGRATGRHRAVEPPVPGAVVGQRFVRCGRCGGVESAVTVHGDIVRCAEGHTVPAGGVQ
ncbi:MAG: hypothetical protein HOV92_18030 [Streptomyces sp.]|nr:hypothetical protein [Streptomyces sp.]